MTTANYFKKQYTDIIKGIAIIMMFIHHFFTFPAWHSTVITYPVFDKYAEMLNEPMKMCVPIFAFLTGYFYWFAKKKNLKYSVRKTTDLYLSYFVVFIIMLILTLFLNPSSINIKDILLELFIIEEPIIKFGWYVFFYFVLLLVLPLFSKICSDKPIYVITCGIIVPCAVLPFIINKLPTNMPLYDFTADMLKKINYYFPCAVVGYLFASSDLFKRLDLFIFNGIKYKTTKIIICLCSALLCLYGEIILPKINFFFDFYLTVIYVPLFVFSLVNLLSFFSDLKYLVVLKHLGKYSLYMWFIHSCFFNTTEKILMPILYLPKDPFLVLIWGMAICYLAARLVEYPASKLIHLKNKILPQ